MIYKYKGSRVVASSRKEAIHKIVADCTADYFNVAGVLCYFRERRL